MMIIMGREGGKVSREKLIIFDCNPGAKDIKKCPPPIRRCRLSIEFPQE
jgi:hypothetical protein